MNAPHVRARTQDVNGMEIVTIASEYCHFAHNVPSCLQPVIRQKIERIKEAAQNEIQKIPKRSDELYDYLYSVAPIE